MPTFSTDVGPLDADDRGTPQPLNLHGFAQGTWPSDNTHYFITDPYNGCTLNVWEWPDALGGGVPTIVADFDQCSETGVAGGFPIDVPQSGGGAIQGNDWRQRGFEYRNGYGWTTDTISCDLGSGTTDCVRWAQVDLMAPSVAPTYTQGGVYAPSTAESGAVSYRTFPDLAVDKDNGMAIGYAKSSSAMFSGIWFTGRMSSFPLGTLGDEAELKTGEATYVAFDGAPYRWGDYTQMAIDPDGCTFWYLGEYARTPGPEAANWGTYIGKFAYPDCGGSSSPEGNVYEVEVRVGGGSSVAFTDCMRFESPDVIGDFTVDGLGIGKWTEVADLGARFLWNAKAGGGGLVVNFSGVSRTDGGLRATGASNSGLHYRVRGFVNPSCSIVEGASSWGR
jgi:hypothetical protein